VVDVDPSCTVLVGRRREALNQHRYDEGLFLPID
jgi:hypothetical protein